MCAWSYYPYAYHYVVLLTLGRRMQDIGGASYVPLLISRGSSSISLTLLFTLSIPCKYLCCHQTPKRGRLKEHFPPFWVLCVWCQRSCRQVQVFKRYIWPLFWYGYSEEYEGFLSLAEVPAPAGGTSALVLPAVASQRSSFEVLVPWPEVTVKKAGSSGQRNFRPTSGLVPEIGICGSV